MDCPPSIQAPAVRIDEKTDPGETGSGVHRVLAQVAREELNHVPDEAASIAAQEFGVDLDELKMLSWFGLRQWVKVRDEVKLLAVEEYLAGGGYHGRTLCGTPDIVAETGDGALLVLDWKSGRYEADHQHQVKGYLELAADKYPGHDKYIGMIAWLRIGEIETLPIMSEGDLCKWSDKLYETVGIGTKPGTPLSPGDHCTLCPRSHECPALAQLMQATARDLDLLDGKEITPADYSSYRPAIKLLEKKIATYDRNLKRILQIHGPQPDGTGRVMSMGKIRTETLYLSEIAKPLAEHWKCQPSEAVDRLGEIGITKKQVQEAAAAATPTAKGKAKAAVLEALRAAGAVQEGMYLKLILKKEQCNGHGT